MCSQVRERFLDDGISVTHAILFKDSRGLIGGSYSVGLFIHSSLPMNDFRPHHSFPSHDRSPPQDQVQPYRGMIFYDGQCPFCLSFVNRFRRSLEKRGYHFVSLHAEGVAQRLRLSKDELLAEMRLLTVDERLFSGADALIHLSREFWWAQPIYYLSWFPGMKGIGRFLYRQIARRRHCLGQGCSLPRSESQN